MIMLGIIVMLAISDDPGEPETWRDCSQEL